MVYCSADTIAQFERCGHMEIAYTSYRILAWKYLCYHHNHLHEEVF